MIAAAGVIGRWGALDDRALAHGINLDRFGVGVARVLVLLLEHYCLRDGGRQRGEERACGVEGGSEGDVAAHCLEVIARAVVMCCFYGPLQLNSHELLETIIYVHAVVLG